jgi:glyoxylate reductase
LVAGAGLDVFEDEPRVHEGLVGNEKVILLPHMGTWTKEKQTQMEEWCISNAEGAVREGVLRSPIPQQAGFWGK